MTRNVVRQILREAARDARQGSLTPAERTALGSGSANGQSAGMVDTTTGDVVGFGLADITPLGQPFRAA